MPEETCRNTTGLCNYAHQDRGGERKQTCQLMSSIGVKATMVKVTAAVIELDGKVLIAKRSKGRFAGKWEFPGGKVEPNETPEECLERELREELGIETRVERLICSSPYDYGGLMIELLAYRVCWLEGEIKPNEHEEIRWVSPGELNEYDFPEADIPIIGKLRDCSHTGR